MSDIGRWISSSQRILFALGGDTAALQLKISGQRWRQRPWLREEASQSQAAALQLLDALRSIPSKGKSSHTRFLEVLPV
jgi:hypothetical protein